MWNNNRINEELQNAVIENNLDRVITLLNKGANANYIKEYLGNKTRDTLLHSTFDVDVTKQLLLHGADVDAQNIYSDTPLHSAVRKEKGLELIKQLLKHGAQVNATNYMCNTPLNYAVTKKNQSIDEIKELLKYGADFNKYTSLDKAVSNVEYAKLLIKFTLIKNFNSNYKEIINLDPYTEHSNYSKLSSFLHDCVSEILQMKTDKITENITLYDLVTDNFTRNTLRNIKICLELAKNDYSNDYIVYTDIIIDRLKPFIDRAKFVKNLNALQVYTVANVSQNIRKIILDSHSLYYIAGYLCNTDLINFIIAFSKFGERENVELGRKNNGFYKHAKRAKLK